MLSIPSFCCRGAIVAVWYGRLAFRMVGSHVALTVLMAALVGLLVTRTGQNALRTSVGERQREVARRAAEEVWHIANEPIIGMRALSVAMNVERAAWERQNLLSQASLEMAAMEEVSLVDTHDNIIATSVLDLNSPLQAGRVLPSGYVSNLSELWEFIKASQVYTSSLEVGGGRPKLTVAVSVREGGRLVGALVAKLNLYTMWHRMERLGYGETGRGVLLEGTGRFIAHPDRKIVFSGGQHELAREIRKKEQGWLEWEDADGVGWVAGFAPVPGIDWHVVVEQQTQEAFALGSLLRAQTLWIVGCCIVGAVVLGLVLVRTIIQPIEKLTRTVHRYSADKLNKEAVHSGANEINELTAAFEEMRQGLESRRGVELALMQQEKLAALGEMAAGVAHEIKNPLAIIKSAAELLKRLEPDELQEREEAIAAIGAAVQRSNEQVLRLLEFGRPGPAGKERVDVNQVLEQILALLNHRIREGDVDLVTRYGAAVVVVTNPDSLKDVLLNLVTNSLDAMPVGGRLVVTTLAGEEHVTVEVEDTGLGMTAEVMARIFDPYFTTKPTGVATGLGLAVGYRQIHEAGGDIRVRSEPGKGTAFCVELPTLQSRLEQ